MNTSQGATPILPKISVDVVIPVRNGERFIEACLDSVRMQTLQPRAVIMVDDGSTDRTPDILNDYAARWDRLKIVRTVARGVSHARNIGIAASRAELVAFLDGDDVWWPNKLEKQLSLFSGSSTEPGFVHCACVQVDERGEPVPGHRIYSPSKRGNIWLPMLNEFYWVTGSASAVIARRQLLLRLGGFDETLIVGEDLDLWQSLARVSSVDYAPDTLVGLRVHADNTCGRYVTTNPELVMFQRLKIWSKWYDRFWKTPGENRILREFREEAATVQVAQLLKRNPEFGLYRRLRTSDLPLARRLFRDRLDYVLNLSQSGIIYDRVKSLVARHIILRNPLLLRLCRVFGKFDTST